MSNYILISDKPLADHEQFLAETIEKLSGQKVTGVALVVTVDTEEGEVVMTGYHNMGLAERQLAAAHINADVVDGIVRANIKDYLNDLNDDGDDPLQ